jgi:hypothetical protein
MEQMINPYGYPSFEAVAPTGEGVLDTLTKITKMVLQHIEMGTSGKQPRSQSAVAEKPPVSPGLAHPDLSPQGALQQGLSESGIPRTATSPQNGLPQPAPSPREQEPSPERHMEPASDLSGYNELEPSVTVAGTKPSIGRIQIVGTDNAEIISANAISVPIRVKIEGDMKVYRIDLAIKLDGFKPED